MLIQPKKADGGLRGRIKAAHDANPAATAVEIAAALGCSDTAVRLTRSKLGLQQPKRGGNRAPRSPVADGFNSLRHWMLHERAEISRHLASKKLPKGQLGGGNCNRCAYKPKPGTPFEKSPCRACPYIGLPPWNDKEAKQEGHGRVVSLSNFENFLGSPGDVHGESVLVHALDDAATMPGEDPDPGAHGDFYATIDAHLEADARRTAETFGGVPKHTPPLESQPTFAPTPILGEPMEEPAEKIPPKKSNFGGVPQEALDVFVEALASISQLSPTQIVAVFRRMAGAEHNETAKELGITPAAVSSAIMKAVEKVPMLGAAIQINAQKNNGPRAKRDSDSGTVAAQIETGKRHPAYARVLEMLASGELGGKVGAMLTRRPLSKWRMVEAVAEMLGIPEGEPVVESAIALIVESGLCQVVTDGRGLFYCTYQQARELLTGGKREVGPDIKRSAYPDGRPVPVLWREGVASLGTMDGASASDIRGKLYDLRPWMIGAWRPVEGFPGLEYELWRGRGGAVWIFRRNKRQGAVLTWHDDGEDVRGSVLDRRLRIWRGKPEALLNLAKAKMRGWFD